jgi:hypothetical protein
MIAIILCLNRRKESSLEELDLPSLSYRYAALKVRGCDPGDRVLRGRTGKTSAGRAPALYSS